MDKPKRRNENSTNYNTMTSAYLQSNNLTGNSISIPGVAIVDLVMLKVLNQDLGRAVSFVIIITINGSLKN